MQVWGAREGSYGESAHSSPDGEEKQPQSWATQHRGLLTSFSAARQVSCKGAALLLCLEEIKENRRSHFAASEEIEIRIVHKAKVILLLHLKTEIKVSDPFYKPSDKGSAFDFHSMKTGTEQSF